MTALAVAAAVGMILGPGAVVAWSIGARGLLLMGLAGPTGIALLAGSAVLAAPLGVPFTWALPVGIAAAVGMAATVLRFRRRTLSAPLCRRDLKVVAAIATSGIAAGLVAFSGLALDAVNSTYDGVFHLNAVAWILDTGNGSSLDLYRMTHPGGDLLEFYPAAWHDLVAATVQLTGAGIPLATNASWVAVTATVWIPGVALLAAVAFARHPDGRMGTAIAGALVASAFTAAPYLLLNWGTLFPTGLAYALLPLGLALTVLALRTAPQPERLPLGVLIGAFAMWLLASGLAHPRSLFSFAVLAAPLLAVAATRAAASRWRDPQRRRGVLLAILGCGAFALLAAGVGWLYVYRTFDVANRPIADHLNGGPATARQDLGTSFLQALFSTPIASPSEAPLPAAALVAVGTIVALVLAAVRREWRWALMSWLLAAVLYTLAAGSNSDFAKLATGIWYKDKYRLISLLPVIAAPLVAATLALVAETVVRRSRTLAVSTALALIVAASAWFGPGLTELRSGTAEQYALSAQAGDGRLLNSDELRLLQSLPEKLPTGARIVGNPWNGSVLAWAIGGREPLFPHLTGDWGPDRTLVAQGFDRILDDPAICEALDRLDARYLLSQPGLLWNGDPQADFFAAIDRIDPATVGTEIARVGDAALYRIAVCP